jgi:hypothetical protein
MQEQAVSKATSTMPVGPFVHPGGSGFKQPGLQTLCQAKGWKEKVVVRCDDPFAHYNAGQGGKIWNIDIVR